VAKANAASADPTLLPARKHWALLLTLGILMIILGTIGLFQPIAYTLATVILFGALMLLSGGAGIATAFKLDNWKGKLAAIILSLVGAFLLASGVIKIWIGVTHRSRVHLFPE
jgi:uncharacterized membrane protein HdeD (DUF308 family)